MTYLLVDAANLFFRARHSTSRSSDAWQRVGFALHVTLQCLASIWRRQKIDHVVWCLEGRSWRKDFYGPYKRNRQEARAKLTPQEVEEDQMFWEAFDALNQFISQRTRCSVLQHPQLEADDLISGWCQAHGNDNHVILSSDSDYIQLLASNVSIYNGVADELITVNGIFNRLGKPVLDRKTGDPKAVPDPQWLIFEKCMRGDISDNVFAAYPGARTKSTKNRVGLQEAFQDRNRRGYYWNNVMLSKWTDHDGVEHRVLDDYQRNQTLIDLSCQPQWVRLAITETIQKCSSKDTSQIGAYFMKFCGKWELIKLSDNAQVFAEIFSARRPDDSSQSC